MLALTRRNSVARENEARCQWIAGTAVLFRVAALKQIVLLTARITMSARLAAAGWKNRVALDAKVAPGSHQGRDTNRPPYFST